MTRRAKTRATFERKYEAKFDTTKRVAHKARMLYEARTKRTASGAELKRHPRIAAKILRAATVSSRRVGRDSYGAESGIPAEFQGARDDFYGGEGEDFFEAPEEEEY